MSDVFCSHTPLKNGIHEIKVLQPTRAAVNQFAEIMSGLYEGKQPTDKPMRFLMDITDGRGLPINYMVDRSREVLMRYPKRPPTRTAIMMRQSFSIRLVDTFIQVMHLKHDVVRFFTDRQREEALAWLMRDD
jgi:hypothetical protein